MCIYLGFFKIICHTYICALTTYNVTFIWFFQAPKATSLCCIYIKLLGFQFFNFFIQFFVFKNIIKMPTLFATISAMTFQQVLLFLFRKFIPCLVAMTIQQVLIVFIIMLYLLMPPSIIGTHLFSHCFILCTQLYTFITMLLPFASTTIMLTFVFSTMTIFWCIMIRWSAPTIVLLMKPAITISI